MVVLTPPGVAAHVRSELTLAARGDVVRGSDGSVDALLPTGVPVVVSAERTNPKE